MTVMRNKIWKHACYLWGSWQTRFEKKDVKTRRNMEMDIAPF